MKPQKAGNSLGVFLNDGDFEAVVLRLEAPVISLFGVTIPGAGRPIIHFQYAKGREIQRRRESILRTRVSGGSWVPVSCHFHVAFSFALVALLNRISLSCDLPPLLCTQNCSNLASEEICDNNNDAHWADFGPRSDTRQTQICKNILINPNNNGDKLMYYNRVIAAELKNPKRESDNYLIRSPDDSKYQAPPRYDFSNDPDANVSLSFFSCSMTQNIPTSIYISISPPILSTNQH